MSQVNNSTVQQIQTCVYHPALVSDSVPCILLLTVTVATRKTYCGLSSHAPNCSQMLLRMWIITFIITTMKPAGMPDMQHCRSSFHRFSNLKNLLSDIMCNSFRNKKQRKEEKFHIESLTITRNMLIRFCPSHSCILPQSPKTCYSVSPVT